MSLKELSFDGKVYMGRIPKGQDLIKEIQGIVEKLGISMGRVEGIGALERARVGYYDQLVQEYRWIDIEESMEVLSFQGNISLKDGSPFVHAHVVLGDNRGNTRGGHVGEGCRVFAFEYIIFPFFRGQLERYLDRDTGLYLWRIEP